MAAPRRMELERRLGLFDATMIIVGNIIGIGIFTTTGLVADALPNPKMILLVWFLGGLLTLCGALTYAELGAMLPQAGGEYVYLREAYGPFWAFPERVDLFFCNKSGIHCGYESGRVCLSEALLAFFFRSGLP